MNLLSGGCLAPGHLARQKFWHIRGPRFFALPKCFLDRRQSTSPCGCVIPRFLDGLTVSLRDAEPDNNVVATAAIAPTQECPRQLFANAFPQQPPNCHSFQLVRSSAWKLVVVLFSETDRVLLVVRNATRLLEGGSDGSFWGRR